MINTDTQQVFFNSFFANTLHEIRTPIQTIIGTLELLSETPLNKEQTEYLRQIQFSSDVLLALANDVLDFSKIRSNQFKLENINFDIRSLIERVTDLICIEAFNKGLEVITDISPDVPDIIIGDPIRVQQVLLNFLKNAVKFTQKGYVRCRVSLVKNKLLFEVIDTGIGLTEETKKHLFTDFFQADASIARKYGGTGLGLSISKSLVTAMKGKIGALQNPSGGSRFWFALPLLLPQDDVQSAQEKLSPPKDTRILIVDDHEIACKSLANKIHQCGLKNISMAYSGNEALATLENAAKNNKPFNAVFIDMIMAGMDGWYLASEIRTKKLCENTKLYLVVPEGQMGGEAKMKLLNWFTDYLYKPVKQKKLYQILESALGLSDGKNKTEEYLNSAAKQSEEQVAHGLSVLVAEDHPVNRKLIVTFLQKYGVKTFEATDGNEAVSMIQQHPETDMIFMDIQMPNKNGIEATDEIRTAGYPGIVIACTANNDFATVEEYERHGINDTLIKPFKSARIKEILLKWQDFRIMPAEPVPEDIPKEIPSSSQELPAWNTKDFEDTIGGNNELGAKLLADFNEQTKQLISQAQTSIPVKNFALLRRVGHTIRGSALSLSILKLSASAEKMDIAAKSLNIEESEKYLKIIKKDFEEFKILSTHWITTVC